MTNLDAFPDTRVDPGVDADERYTLRETEALCQRLAGVDDWDLDAAACEESHLATYYYSRELSGLTWPWFEITWVNPPYSNIRPWVEKAWEMVLRGNVYLQTPWGMRLAPSVIAMLLPANRADQGWWQELVEPFRDNTDSPYAHPISLGVGWHENVRLKTNFLPGRIKYGHPGNKDGIGVGSPPFGSVLLVWRRM